ncbi:MAG: sodium:solute symporter, partial [Gemmatimonadota bacterium]
MTAGGALDLLVLVVYLVGVTAWGARLGRGVRGGREYFLGDRDLPWGAVLLSVVATETSTLTFLSIPGVAYVGTVAFLQLALGYVVGRILVAAWLLPAYWRGEQATAYQLLEVRFGGGVRRLTSAIFMVTRLLADSVRLFATAIPLALITGWPYPASIAAIAAATFLYTYAGGIRSVVWVDAVQMGLYLLGGMVALILLEGLVPGGWQAIASTAAEAGKLRVIDLSTDLSVPYTLWAGVLGGAFLSMGSHGTDHLMVQRLLACRGLRDSRRALVGSGVAVLLQFALFLAVGIGLWAFYRGAPFERPDEIFARFIVEELPPGVRGLLVAGVFAAAMSTVSSSINALASASTYDFWGAARPDADDRTLLGVGRAFTVLWAVLLVAGAILFIPLSRGGAAVEVSLGIASLVYGGLLGAFLLARFVPRATSGPAAAAVLAGIGGVTLVWATSRDAVAWPWFVPVGTAVTFA